MNFHWIDGAIIVVYLVILSAIGFYFSKRQKGIEDFFLARRSMAWFPVGLSLMAALNSGIDYLMQPSAIGKYGAVLLVGTSSWLMLYPWVAKVTLPFYRRLNSYTAYEYLERRFDVRVRTLAATIFLLWRLGWMGTAMYVPCLAVSAATGGRLPLVPMIVALGCVVTLYTMLGGIKAIIWTDVVQFCIMFGGLAATVAIVLMNVPGGLGEIWSTAQAAGKTSLAIPIPGASEAGFFTKMGLFFKQDITIIGILIATMVGRMALYTGDQVMVQRLQTTRTVKDARQAFVINAVGDALWMFGLGFVGLALFAYTQTHGLPPGFKPDEGLPYFMSRVFPVGVVGLVIAAIFAASLSSIDSAINSCTSVVIIDFYNRLFLKRQAKDQDTSPEGQRGQILISRMATVVFGVIAIILASNVARIGDLIEIANKVIQLFTGPLLGIYILGMFTQRSRAGGVLIGGALGAVMSAYVAFWSPLGFLWPTVMGFGTTYVLGYALSVMQGPAPKSQISLTFKSVMSLAEGSVAEESVEA